MFSSKIKTEYGYLGDACTWWLNSKLLHDRKQDSADWGGIPVYDCSREEAAFIIVCKGGDLVSSSLVNPFKEDSAQGGYSDILILT